MCARRQSGKGRPHIAIHRLVVEGLRRRRLQARGPFTRMIGKGFESKALLAPKLVEEAVGRHAPQPVGTHDLVP